ncbi:MAG: adenosine deaminase [Lachnospiraceae bacterium]
MVKGISIRMIDLHVHLDGSLEPSEILQLAELSQVPLPTNDVYELRNLLTVQEDCTSLSEYLEKFKLPLTVLQTDIEIERSVCFLVTKLAKQGLCYAEIRFAPQLHIQKGFSQNEIVTAAVNGLKKGIQLSGMPCQLILCCMRGNQNYNENIETIAVSKHFLHKGICAVDLAGNESAYPTNAFTDVFDYASQLDIPIIIHAGEAAGAQSVKQALELGAVRIGHGIHAIEDLELLRTIKSKKIILETCFTSNLQTKSIEQMKDYPIKDFMDYGVLVTVNTDNMTVSGTTLKKEYQLLKEYFFCSEEMLKQFALNAAEGAFVSKHEKEILCNQIYKNFHTWLLE